MTEAERVLRSLLTTNASEFSVKKSTLVALLEELDKHRKEDLSSEVVVGPGPSEVVDEPGVLGGALVEEKPSEVPSASDELKAKLEALKANKPIEVK